MIKVEYIRDGLVEEVHTGVWVSAKPIEGFSPDNSHNNPYFLRSCAKPLQATLLLDNEIDLTPEELAFCSASHAGEDCHIKVALKLLKKLKLKEEMLKCGIHAPLSKGMQNRMIVRGDSPTVLHNNCSGKHIGFLALCDKNGWPIVSMPLKNLAEGYVRLLEYPKLLKAIKCNPYIFGGEGRTDTEIISKTENLIAKVGAGGLCVVLNVQECNAFVVKIDDASVEARRFALLEIINRLGWGEIKYDNRIKTIAGKVVGQVVVSV